MPLENQNQQQQQQKEQTATGTTTKNLRTASVFSYYVMDPQIRRKTLLFRPKQAQLVDAAGCFGNEANAAFLPCLTLGQLGQTKKMHSLL